MFASLQDVSVRLGRPITDPNEIAQVEAWIDDVEARILQSLPGLPDAILAGAPSQAIVAAVVAAVVIRKIRNPEGYRSERIDDYSYDRGSAGADLTLTDDEWAQLSPTAPGGAFSVRPYHEPDRATDWWWSA